MFSVIRILDVIQSTNNTKLLTSIPLKRSSAGQKNFIAFYLQAVGKKKLWSTEDILIKDILISFVLWNIVEEHSICETCQAFLSLKLHLIDGFVFV